MTGPTSVFDASLEPAVTVRLGESILVETEDAHSGAVTGPEVVYETLDDVMDRIGGANPVTGPIAIEGVRAGDCVAVRIEHVEGAPVTGFGYMTTTPTLHPSLQAETVICHRRGDRVEIPTRRGPVSVPCRPFVGTLGVAPAGEPVLSFRQGVEFLGNVDLPEIAAGATVVLRAAVDRGMVSLGDAHLAQGDAEIHRSAIECQADVTLRFGRSDPAAAGFSGLPQVNTATRWGSAAPGTRPPGGSGPGGLRRSGPPPATHGPLLTCRGLPPAGRGRYRSGGTGGTAGLLCPGHDRTPLRRGGCRMAKPSLVVELMPRSGIRQIMAPALMVEDID